MPRIELVLAASDGSEYGARAVQTGAALARRAGAAFEIVAIVEVIMLPQEAGMPQANAGEFEDVFSQEARKKVEAQAAEAGVVDAPVHIQSGFSAPLISRTAQERDADITVMGAHPHPALARFLVGSTAERVIRTAHRPVMVAVEPRTAPFQRILVAVDLSAHSRRVLRAAAAIARADDAELRVLYAREPLPPMLVETGGYDEEAYRRLGPEQLESVVAEADTPPDLRTQLIVLEGRAGDAVLREASERNADLIVMGSHGFGFFERLLLGSTSIHVLRHSERATVIVPPVDGE